MKLKASKLKYLTLVSSSLNFKNIMKNFNVKVGSSFSLFIEQIGILAACTSSHTSNGRKEESF